MVVDVVVLDVDKRGMTVMGGSAGPFENVSGIGAPAA